MTKNQHDPYKRFSSTHDQPDDLRQRESAGKKGNDPLWSWADENDNVESDISRLKMEDSLKKEVQSTTNGSGNKNSLNENRFSISREEEDFLIGTSEGLASAEKQTGVTAQDTVRDTSGSEFDNQDSSKGDGFEKHLAEDFSEQLHEVHDASDTKLHGFTAFDEGQDEPMDNSTETASPQQNPKSIRAKRSRPASLNLLRKKSARSSSSGGTKWLRGITLLFLVVFLGGSVYIYQSINQIQGQLKKINQRIALLDRGSQSNVPVETGTSASETRLLDLEQSIFDLQHMYGSLNTDQLMEEMQIKLENVQQKLDTLEGRFSGAMSGENSIKQAAGGYVSQENKRVVIDKAPPTAGSTISDAPEETEGTTGPWFINLVSFPVQDSALVWHKKIEAAGYKGDVQEIVFNGKQWYRVRLVGLPSLAEARKLRLEVEQRLGLKKTWISKK